MNLLLLVVTGVVVLAFSAIIFYRNAKVYKYRLGVVDRIYNKQLARIDAGLPAPLYAYEIMDYVSYNEMVFKFWKPLDSFFPEEYRENKNGSTT